MSKENIDEVRKSNEDLNDSKLKEKENLNTDETQETVCDEKEIIEKELKGLKEENLKYKDENVLLSNKLKAMEEKYTNLFAEYDNYRKRTAKEKEAIYDDSCVEILKEFLPVLDNLERAIEADGSLEELKTGVEMTLKGFQTAFEKLSVEEIDIKDGFDPNFHNAVMHVNDESFGQNEVVEVFQKGYKKGDKIIRYSMVKVAN